MKKVYMTDEDFSKAVKDGEIETTIRLTLKGRLYGTFYNLKKCLFKNRDKS